jgi:hypothetical protein
VAKKYINFNKTTMKTHIEQWEKERNINNFEKVVFKDYEHKIF